MFLPGTCLLFLSLDFLRGHLCRKRCNHLSDSLALYDLPIQHDFTVTVGLIVTLFFFFFGIIALQAPYIHDLICVSSLLYKMGIISI